MQIFECDHCGQLVFFTNSHCVRCGSTLGFEPERLRLHALHPDGELWRIEGADGRWRRCANAVWDACNWLVPSADAHPYCLPCRLNRTVPSLDEPTNVMLWRKVEAAKHLLVYGLLRLALPVAPKWAAPETGLAFDFLADPDPSFRDEPQVMTGHAAGVVTLNIREADDLEREKARHQMAEPYRTLIGHFRHEIGHYYWDILVKPGAWLEPCREMFGDERADYGAALERHYAEGPPEGWPERFVTAYATAHPWEDFAETWAHYLHIVDALDTAAAFGLSVAPRTGQSAHLAATVAFDPYREWDFDRLIGAWLPTVYAMNCLNESMGQPDFYPFVLAPAVIDKLRFVHRLVHER